MQSKMKSITNIVVFLAALFLIITLRGKSTASVSIDKGSMTFSGPGGYHRVIDYDEIQLDGITLIDTEDLEASGQALSGGENRKYRWGQWDSDTLGEYTACVIRKLDTAVLFETTAGETVIFNIESDDTTASLAASFSELVAYYQDNNIA